MAVNKEEVTEWLDAIPDHVLVAIDDGGLALVASNTAGSFTSEPTDGPYFEIGGTPRNAEEGNGL
jgi:hypothetical protein